VADNRAVDKPVADSKQEEAAAELRNTQDEEGGHNTPAAAVHHIP